VDRYIVGDSAVADEGVRAAAVRALSHIPAQDAERLLLAALVDASATVRVQAVAPFAAGHRQPSATAHAALLAAREDEEHHEVMALLERYASSSPSRASWASDSFDAPDASDAPDAPEKALVAPQRRRTLLATADPEKKNS
jgi:hypothetical protein